MSTIASPRLSSTRSSIDTTTSTGTTIASTTSPSFRPAVGAAPAARRNRSALRDFYNLPATASRSSSVSSGVVANDVETASLAAEAGKDGEERILEDTPPSELDAEGFDAQTWVGDVLRREGLEGLLEAEGGLLNEIKGLDGERKALVYDNYSKLITATDTIRKMRSNMDPLTPTTSTLSPAISHIAQTAADLAIAVPGTDPVQIRGAGAGAARTQTISKLRRQRDTVKRVLDAPSRLKKLLGAGREEEAEKEWAVVKSLLQKWGDVKGVDEVRRACGEVMEESPSTED